MSSAKSNQGFSCPLSESLDSIACINGKQRTRCMLEDSLSLTSLNLVSTIVPNRGFSQKSKQNGKSVEPDETARYEPSHQDLHSLQTSVLVCRAEMVTVPTDDCFIPISYRLHVRILREMNAGFY